jgi:hypothetical protein
MALWARESPKYAILRQTTKHPMMPVTTAIPIPAISVMMIKLSIMVCPSFHGDDDHGEPNDHGDDRDHDHADRRPSSSPYPDQKAV